VTLIHPGLLWVCSTAVGVLPLKFY